MGKSKRVKTITLVLVLACLIVALYAYIDRTGGKEKKAEKTLAAKMLERNLDTTYPPTPYSVAELYCGIVECLYKSDTTKEQKEALVHMERQLFDDEFAAINPYEQLLLATEAELLAATEKKIVFTGYVVEKASNIEKWEIDGTSYASVMVQFACRSSNGSGNSYRKLILRRDKNDRYKILGWKTEEAISEESK